MTVFRCSRLLPFYSLLVLALAPPPCQAQGKSIGSAYGAIADSIYRAATGDSLAYIRLGRLVDTFGSRISGSPALEAAIDLAEREARG